MKKKGKTNTKSRANVLRTKRLELSPMTAEEIEKLIAKTEDEHLKNAYTQMLADCQKNLQMQIWYAPWKICLLSNGVQIGDAGFKGPQMNSGVEIGYGIQKEYEGQGYTTEAVRALIDWAFSQEEVYFVEAETEPENKASQRILEKLGFKSDGVGEEGPRFVLEKTQTSWTTLGMLFGMSMGMSFGVAQDNIGIGMSIGMGLGLLWGFCIDKTQKNKMEELRQKRKENNEGKN